MKLSETNGSVALVGRAKKKNKKSDFGRRPPTLVEGGQQRTLAEYQEALGRTIAQGGEGFDPLPLVFGLVDLARNVEEALSRDGRYTIFSVATALYCVLRVVRNRYPIEGPFQTHDDYALQLTVQAEGVEGDAFIEFVRSTVDPAQRSEAARLHIIGLLCEGSLYQGDFLFRVCNSLVLTGLVGFKGLPAAPGRTEALFRARAGIGAYDYVRALFGLWSFAQTDALLDLQSIIREGPEKDRLTRDIEKVAGELSKRVDEYASLEALPSVSAYTGKALASAFLARFPLIQINPRQFLIPSPAFLRIQLSSKFLTKALAFARDVEKASSRGITDYSGFIGRERLEPFFRELCELWRPGEHFGEYEYSASSNEKSSDRIVFERHGSGEVAVLFQLKAKMLREPTHHAVEIDSVVKDLGSAFAEAIAKSIKFLFRATDARNSGRLEPKTASLTARVLDASKWCLIGIVPDLPPLFILRHVRELLMAEVDKQLSQTERDWFRSHQRKIVWHILDLAEFESFLSLPVKEREFYKRLSAYMRWCGPDRAVIDKHGKLPTSFRDFLIQKYAHRFPDGALPPFAPLVEVFESLRKDIGAYFGFAPRRGRSDL